MPDSYHYLKNLRSHSSIFEKLKRDFDSKTYRVSAEAPYDFQRYGKEVIGMTNLFLLTRDLPQEPTPLVHELVRVILAL